MTTQTLLGFDFGMKRIGVAVGQTVTQTARPLTTLKAVNGTPDWRAVEKLIGIWQPDAIVVGIPLNMDGTEQPISHSARQFSAELHQRFEFRGHNQWRSPH